MKIRHCPPAVRILLDEERLRCWLATAKAGDILEYHRGVLVIDRLPGGGRLAERDRRDLDRVADAVFRIASANRGYLVQRRHGDGDYSYLFVQKAPAFPLDAS